jgi:hypothetical protein
MADDEFTLNIGSAPMMDLATPVAVGVKRKRPAPPPTTAPPAPAPGRPVPRGAPPATAAAASAAAPAAAAEAPFARIRGPHKPAAAAVPVAAATGGDVASAGARPQQRGGGAARGGLPGSAAPAPVRTRTPAVVALPAPPVPVPRPASTHRTHPIVTEDAGADGGGLGASAARKGASAAAAAPSTRVPPSKATAASAASATPSVPSALAAVARSLPTDAACETFSELGLDARIVAKLTADAPTPVAGRVAPASSAGAGSSTSGAPGGAHRASRAGGDAAAAGPSSSAAAGVVRGHLRDGFGLKRPTRVQRLVVPRALTGTSLCVRSETGSGKTLAFLAPIVQSLLPLVDRGTLAREDGTLAIVLTPTRELCGQIFTVASRLLQVRAPGCDGRLPSHVPPPPRLCTSSPVCRYPAPPPPPHPTHRSCCMVTHPLTT